MTELGNDPRLYRLPPSAWALGWLCLLGQLLQLTDRGLSQSDGVFVLLSVVLSAAVVAWFSAGVIRGRTVRLVIVWIALSLGALLSVIGILIDLSDLDAWAVLELGAAIGQVVALARFCSTSYFRWQRTRPQLPGPDISGLVAIAVVVGMVGGITAPADGGNPPFELRIGL